MTQESLKKANENLHDIHSSDLNVIPLIKRSTQSTFPRLSRVCKKRVSLDVTTLARTRGSLQRSCIKFLWLANGSPTNVCPVYFHEINRLCSFALLYFLSRALETAIPYQNCHPFPGVDEGPLAILFK